MAIWQGLNVMNNTIWDIKTNKIHMSKPISNPNYIGGKLWQYCPHSYHSQIVIIHLINMVPNNTHKHMSLIMCCFLQRFHVWVQYRHIIKN